jgi:hypothetical protein
MKNHGTGHVGTIDRLVRLILAIILISFSLFCPFARTLGPVFVWSPGVIGVILLVTALLGRCPLYRMLRIHS